MKLLFIHQNFPGQFGHLAPALAAIPGNQVVALVDAKNRQEAKALPGVRLISYDPPKDPSAETHWYIRGFETQVRRGQQIAKLCMAMKREGFVPDIICVHTGWGEALFLRDVFPESIILGYFEFFYHASGADVGFDNDCHTATIDEICRLRIRNSCHLLSLDLCDWGLTPTQWQASQFPEIYRPRMSVIHEGVDTRRVRPNADASFELDGRVLTRRDKVVTFVNRNLEPYRGFHIFMRSLPEIMKRCPDAEIVIVGGDEVSYGRAPSEGGRWRDKMMAEVGDSLDASRLHFVGRIPYPRYISLLQISSVHAYLTYPFVLSWSMLEAMSMGCVVVGSGTPPVTEVIEHGQNGLLVDFFDSKALAEQVLDVLARPDDYLPMRENARSTIIERYDMQTVCLPQQIALLQNLAKA